LPFGVSRSIRLLGTALAVAAVVLALPGASAQTGGRDDEGRSGGGTADVRRYDFAPPEPPTPPTDSTAHLFSLPLPPIGRIDPATYVLGAGDILAVWVHMAEPIEIVRTMVGAEGTVYLGSPVGSLRAAGLTIEQFQNAAQKAFEYYYTSPRADVQLNRLRTFAVELRGNVKWAGVYRAPVSATVLQLIQSAGGVEATGTQRRLELVRKDGTTVPIDLRKRTLGIDDSPDIELREDDLVRVGPIGNTAEIRGAVRVPGIVEFIDGETLRDVLELVGGLDGRAKLDAIVWRRHNGSTVVTLRGDLNTALAAGDSITIPAVETLQVAVEVAGAVRTAGPLDWSEGLTLVGALNLAGPTPQADLRRVRVEHTTADNRRVVTWCDVLGPEGPDPGAAGNIALQQGDAVTVPTYATGLGEVQLVGPFRGLGAEDASGRATGTRFFRITERETLTSVLRATGGLRANGNPRRIEILRQVADGRYETLTADLTAIDAGQEEDPVLRPGDLLRSYERDQYRPRVEVAGELYGDGLLAPYEPSEPVPTIQSPSKPTRRATAVITEGYTLRQLCDDLRFAPNADRAHIEVRRIIDGAYRLFVVDYTAIASGAEPEFRLENADKVFVPSLEWRLEEIIVVGEFFGNGAYAASAVEAPPALSADKRLKVRLAPGSTLEQLLIAIGGLSSHANGKAAYVLRREADRTEKRIPTDIDALAFQSDEKQNIVLQHGDTVVIPRLEEFVKVIGVWANPGAFPYVEGWRVADYVAQAGPLNTRELKTKSGCLLVRNVNDPARREVLRFDYNEAARGNPEHNLAVRPGDAILADQVNFSGWRDWVEMLPGAAILRSLIQTLFP
jgi:protein involved in polysaccharide export with SLBB domain